MKHYLFFLLLAIVASCKSNAANSENTQPVNQNVDVPIFKELLSKESIQIVDVRTADEYNSGYIKGAVNYDFYTTFKEQAKQLDKTKPTLVYCLSGGRSAQAANYLSTLGFKEVYNLQGGMIAWKAAQQEVVSNNTTPVGNQVNAAIGIEEYTKLINSAPLVLIDFNATWCLPCKKLAPIVEALEQEMGTFKLHKVDFDKSESIHQSVGVGAIPLLILYKNGKEVWRKLGLTDKATLQAEITKHQ